MRHWVCVFAAVLAGAVHAGNWPRFRGPNGAGFSDAQGIPVRWSPSDYLWKTALPDSHTHKVLLIALVILVLYLLMKLGS